MMPNRYLIGLTLLVVLLSHSAWAQSTTESKKFTEPKLLGDNTNSGGKTAVPASAQKKTETAKSTERPRVRTNRSRDSLPNEQGQIWQEYDLRPYTSKVTDIKRPEQAVTDWILRETGTELWFSEPLGILNASRDKLLVYHTPDVQNIVEGIVDRFVASEGERCVLGLQLVTVGSPNWRSKAFAMLQPVTVQSPGVEAWLVSRENAAILLAELTKRTDCRQHNAPSIVIHNGQSQTITRTQPKTFARTVRPRDGAVGGAELINGRIDEGYSLQVGALMSLDNRSVDGVIRCQIDQVEKLVPVNIDLPGPSGSKQSQQIQIPQLVSWRLHERFRWPADQVLLLSCGVVATPNPDRSALRVLSLAGDTTRADALLFISYQGRASQVLLNGSENTTATTGSSRNRY